jgi:hypothetical protein
MNTSENLSSIQNSSEHYSNLQNTSEDFSIPLKSSKRAPGFGRGKKYPGAALPPEEYQETDFSLIMEEAYTLFESAGERRSVRMIAEYCKTGELVCYYDSDDKRWHINPDSVQSKIEKIKALNARASQRISQATSEDFKPLQNQNPTPPPEASEKNHEVEQTIKRLEQEVLDLRITNRGKDYFIEQLQNERNAMLDKVEKNSLMIGELRTKLLQLEAPKPPTEYREQNNDVSQ